MGDQDNNLLKDLHETNASRKSVQGMALTPPEKRPLALVIEDDADCRSLCRRVLSLCELDCIEAEDGEQGLRAWEKRSPDLVLLDIMMPGTDGMMVLEQAREKDLSGRVIMTTAVLRKETIQHAGELGVTAYMAKPFDIDRMFQTLKKCLPNLKEPDFSKARISTEQPPAPEAAGDETAETENAPNETQSVSPQEKKATTQLRLEAEQLHEMDRAQELVFLERAIHTCARTGDPLPERIREQLSDAPSPAVVKLVDILLSSDNPAERRVLASILNDDLLDRCYTKTMQLLRDPDPETRRIAFLQAATLSHPAVRNELFAALSSSDAGIRQAALAALRRCALGAVPRVFLESMMHDIPESKPLASSAMRFLASMADNVKELTALIAGYTVQKPNIKRYIRDLTEFLFEDPADIKMLLDLLGNRDEEVQVVAAEKIIREARKQYEAKWRWFGVDRPEAG